LDLVGIYKIQWCQYEEVYKWSREEQVICKVDPPPPGPFSTKVGISYPWVKGIQNEGQALSPRKDKRLKIHWKFLKIIFSRTRRSISIKLSISNSWVKGIQICTNKVPGRLQRWDNRPGFAVIRAVAWRSRESYVTDSNPLYEVGKGPLDKTTYRLRSHVAAGVARKRILTAKNHRSKFAALSPVMWQPPDSWKIARADIIKK
jgi:hypothetical protein